MDWGLGDQTLDPLLLCTVYVVIFMNFDLSTTKENGRRPAYVRSLLDVSVRE